MADIRPGIRVLALRLSQYARVLEMPEADVVGGEREPGAIGFRHMLRDHAQHLGQIGRASRNVLHGIAAIGDAHRPRGLGRQHHDARGAIVAGGLIAPVRFLVTDGRQQPPVQALNSGRLLEPGAQFRQARADVVLEAARLLVLKAAGLGFGVAGEPAQQSRIARTDEEPVHRVAQLQVGAAHQPLHRTRVGKGEGDEYVRVQMACKLEVVAIDDGKIGVSAAHPVERIGLLARQFGPGEVGCAARAQVAEQLQLRAVGSYHDTGAVQRGDIVRR